MHEVETLELNKHDKNNPIKKKSEQIGKIITRAISKNNQANEKHENSEKNRRKLSDVSSRVSTMPNNKRINKFQNQAKELKNEFGNYEDSQQNHNFSKVEQRGEKRIEKREEKKQIEKWSRSKSSESNMIKENGLTTEERTIKRDQRLKEYQMNLKHKLNNLSNELNSLQTLTPPNPKTHSLNTIQSKAGQNTRKLSYPFMSLPSEENEEHNEIKNLSLSTNKLEVQLSDEDEDVFYYGELHHKCIHCVNLTLKREEIKIPTGLKNIKLTNLSDNLKHKSHLFS